MLKEDMKADLDVFYNTDEFALECIYKSRKLAVLFAKADMEFFETDFKRVTAKKEGFEDLEDGDVLLIDGRKYLVQNYSIDKNFQISISIKEDE